MEVIRPMDFSVLASMMSKPIAGSEVAGEIDITACQFAGTFLSVDTLELHQGCRVTAETVFLDKKRYEDAIDVEDEVVGINTVEDIIVEEERDLSPDTVTLTEPTDFIDFLLLNHLSLLVIFAPRALRRPSMSS